MKKLSVVVPIYNVEKYLNQCLDSLLYQDGDYQVIMVNDGSKDSSGDIALHYANKYPDKFKLINQENQGLGPARNTGLNHTDSEYVSFLDSDDWLKGGAIAEYLKTIEEYQPDLILTNPVCYNNKTHNISNFKDEALLDAIFSDKSITNAKERCILYTTEFCSTRKIYKTSLFKDNDIKFKSGLYEDGLPHFQILSIASKLVYLKKTGFVYRVNTNHQITSFVDSRVLHIFKVFEDIFDFAYKSNNQEMMCMAMNQFYNYNAWLFNCIEEEYSAEYISQLHKILQNLPKIFIKSWKKLMPNLRRKRLFIHLYRSNLLFRFIDTRKKYYAFRNKLERLNNNKLVRFLKKVIRFGIKVLKKIVNLGFKVLRKIKRILGSIKRRIFK